MDEQQYHGPVGLMIDDAALWRNVRASEGNGGIGARARERARESGWVSYPRTNAEEEEEYHGG